jgi:Kef-type K+ transport system membrane component KefB/nucleotide-binding universal stress UspA family protein
MRTANRLTGPFVLLAAILLPMLLWAAEQAGNASQAAAGGAMHKGPSEWLFVLQLVVLMVVGRLLGEAMLRLKQPAVMGQLIAGLVLGPSLFGLLLPDIQHALFPRTPEQKAMIDAISQFGILLLLLLTGMETDLRLVRQTGRASVFASLMGIIVPFACGVALGEMLPDSMLPDPEKRLVTSLFLGTALSIASVKIVAMVVREMNFLRRTVGQVILASAIIDDSIGWIIVSIIFSIALHGSIDLWSLAGSITGVFLFMVASFTIGRRAVFFAIRWVNDTFVSEFAVITAILVIMGVMALITNLIGVHTVLGAFVAGILVGESPILTRHIDEQLRGIITAFFAPVFFGMAGLTADLTILADPNILMLTVGLILIASIGKFGGAFIGAELGGLTRREGFALACGMNARGSTEVIIATVGLSMGALSQNLFTMIVAMAVITTTAMPPTLRWALSRIPMRKEEKQRLEREALEERGFVPNLERLLIAVDDSSNGRFASRVAGMLAGTHGMPTTVLHINENAKAAKPAKSADDDATPRKERRRSKVMAASAKSTTKKSATSKADKAAQTPQQQDADEKRSEQEIKDVVINAPAPRAAAKAEKAGATVKNAAEETKNKQNKEEKIDAEIEVTAIVHKSPSARAIAEEAKKGYDLLLIGLEKTSTRQREFHPAVTEIAQGFGGPLAITATRGELDKMPNNDMSILVAVNGTEQARRGAEVAIVLARAVKSPLTVLYVAPRGSDGKRKRRSSTRRNEEAILKDVVDIAGGYNMSIRTAVLADSAAEDAILKEAERRKHNLIVLGVGRRPGDKLFFGDTAAGLLADAECSLLFVAS